MIREIINFLLYYDYIIEFLGLKTITGVSFEAMTWTYVITYAIITLTVFFLKGIGLYSLSKKNGIDKAFLSFIPFVSYYQMGRLVGSMSVFKMKVKNLGIIVGALLFVTVVLSNVVEFFRYFETLQSILNSNSFIPVTDAAGIIISNNSVLWTVLYYVNLVLSLIETILFIFLVIVFFRFYAKRNFIVFAILSIIIDPLFGIFVFVVRNNKKGAYYQRPVFSGQPYGGYDPQNDPFGGQNGQRNDQGGQYRPNNHGFSATQNQRSPFDEYNKPASDDVFEEYSQKPAGTQENKTEFKPYEAPPRNTDDDDLF